MAVAPPAILDPDIAPIEGQTLRSTAGSWTRGPRAYAYRWQRCSQVDDHCLDIPGATGRTYRLSRADVGDNVQAVVTARNQAGSSTAISNYTPAISPENHACTRTIGPFASLQAAMAGARGGATICLRAGNYGAVALSDVTPAAAVTVQPVSGARVRLAALTLTGAMTDLTFQGFDIPGAISDVGPARDLTFRGNITSPGGESGVGDFFYAGAPGHVQAGIRILDSQMDHITNAKLDGNLSIGAAAGQCVTILGSAVEEHDFTVSGNVCGPGIGNHYYQVGGIAGFIGRDNTMLGPVSADALASGGCGGGGCHNNVLMIFGRSLEINWSDNVMRRTDSRGNTVLLVGPLTDVTVDDNLDVEDPMCVTDANCHSTAYYLDNVHGLEFIGNTTIDSYWGLVLTRYERSQGSLLSGRDYMIEHNIVAPAIPGGGINIEYNDCDSDCVYDYNVTGDSSADRGGAAHSVTNWRPRWTELPWFQPLGLPFPAGYPH